MIEQNRQELYKGIWNLASGLRGSIDSWEFKNYILGFLFYRYISEDFVNYMNNRPGMEPGFKYEDEPDDAEWIRHMKETFIEEKGYFIYPSDLFINIKRKADLNQIDDLNEEVWYAFERIEGSTQCAASKKDFEGLFKIIDLADNKLGREIGEKNRRIKDILSGVHQMECKLGDSDIFGDAYEYLIGMYAADAGKAGGEFYTPPEVSRLLVKLVCLEKRIEEINTVYDPTCGSGSLLLKFGNDKDIEFFGQEINFTTYNLCRMNMFLHKIGYSNFEIALGDTLINDKFPDRTFDAIVSNPPYGTKWIGDGMPELMDDPRFSGPGVLAPKSKSDFAFILHSLHHLEDDGIAAIVCFPGILFRDKAEKQIRKYLVDNRNVYAIIQLPDNLFFGTSIATCILILRKDRTEDGSILFVDARDSFEKSKGRNILSDENIEQIAKFYKAREDVEWYCKVVSLDEIKERDYDLSVHTYVIRQDEEEEVDIQVINSEATELSRKLNELNERMDALIKKMENNE